MDAERLAKGVAQLESLGFRTRVPAGILERKLFTAGGIERRLAEVQSLFADDEVAGILCARGGAGAGRLLGRLDAGLVQAQAKVFIGYSDATFLHLLLNKAGLVTFHGPMVARDIADGAFDRDGLLRAVTGGGLYASEPDDLLPLRPGTAEGRLRGGCLSILAAAAGTPWALRPEGEPTILFLEDVDEPPYKIDRMLGQLRDSGAFDGVRGVVFGDMTGCSPKLSADYTLEDVLIEGLEGLEAPVALGLSSGHAAGPNVTLPLGVRARLACDEEARFEILEAAVA